MMIKPKSWIVAKLKPNHDKTAFTHLERQNFEFFQPTFKTLSRTRNSFKDIIKPVFPGYIFVAIELEEKKWHKLNYTRGISNIIVFGREIPVLHNELIQELKNRFAITSTSEVFNEFEVGMSAEITNGPFAQLNGKIDEIEANQRIWILLDILGNQTRVSLKNFNLTPFKY